MNMNFEGFNCPVCGKYDFYEIDSLEMCPHCGWQINLVQYDNHDLSEAGNILSVNESILEYNLLQNKASADKATELQANFVERRSQIQRDFRNDTLHDSYNRPSCNDFHAIFVDLRNEYIAKLNKLKEEIGA